MLSFLIRKLDSWLVSFFLRVFLRAEHVVLSNFKNKHESQLKSTHFKEQYSSMKIASFKQERETKTLSEKG